MRSSPSAVKRLALARGLEVFQPDDLRAAPSLARITGARPEALVVAAYGLILPPAVLAVAPLGAINIHASLLPRWRGAAPIQRALQSGDRETGITIMRMDAGLDTGPVLAQAPVPIASEDDALTLHDKLAALGARMVVAALADLKAGRARAVPQPESGATYARKITKSDAQIDWHAAASEIERLVRALRPHPGAVTHWRADPLKIWGARVEPGRGTPGTVLEANAGGIVVACGKDALRVLELQRPGGKRLNAGDFLRGCPLAPGDQLR
jgi:methionyl-tRNA formyltransferase